MAEFKPAFEKMIINEGGFKLHNVAGDRGGMTYAGIARNYHPDWPGWRVIDNNIEDLNLTQLVRDFYKKNYWDAIEGDHIKDQDIAESIFDFSVNAGIKIASKLAQMTVGTTPDGVIGPKTIDALNDGNPMVFKLGYTLLKITRYAEICTADKSQSKFLLGWINRALKGV